MTERAEPETVAGAVVLHYLPDLGLALDLVPPSLVLKSSPPNVVPRAGRAVSSPKARKP